jgi:hypothetical protein
MTPRLDALVAIYKKITIRDLTFEFKTDHSFYVVKKWFLKLLRYYKRFIN